MEECLAAGCVKEGSAVVSSRWAGKAGGGGVSSSSDFKTAE